MKQIPSLGGVEPVVRRPLEALKENIEELRGVRSTKIAPLSESATSSEIITKINELITRLQG